MNIKLFALCVCTVIYIYTYILCCHKVPSNVGARLYDLHACKISCLPYAWCGRYRYWDQLFYEPVLTGEELTG